jgi:hypothetical protein
MLGPLLLLLVQLTRTAERDAFFESTVRPLLAERCYECHSDRTKRPKGALRVDSLAALLQGGSSGPALVPGKPDESLLVRALRYADEELQMPPTGKLAQPEIDVLARWIADGAHWPGEASAATSAGAVEAAEPLQPYAPSAAALAHWAFQPIERVEPPEVDDPEWSLNPLDRFVKAALDARGSAPTPLADPRTLYLRACFDLTGLPPTRAELDAFLADAAPDAWERAVDRLLESPHYGERSARRWLDLARYADSNGVDENLAMSEAWRYRDWVVRAFQADLPYDRFLTWQLAGDLVERDERDFDPLIATAFLALGPKMLAEQDKEKLRADVVDEQLDVAARAFLGLTVGCARCHDHKFDPLPQTDYYALAGVFRGTATLANTNFVSRWNERALGTPDEIAAREAHAQAEEGARNAIAVLRERGESSLAPRLSAQLAAYLLAGARLAPHALLLEAEEASRGNWIRDAGEYGTPDDVLARTGHPGLQYAEWDVVLPTAGRWRLLARYAAEESRPLRLALNGAARTAEVLGEVTGGWRPEALAWSDLGELELLAGRNVLRLERDGAVPHVDALLCVPASALEAELAHDPPRSPEFAAACAALAKRPAPAHSPWIALWRPYAELSEAEFETRAVEVAAALRERVANGSLAIPASLLALVDAPPPRSRDELAARVQIALASAAQAAAVPERKATTDEQVAADLVHARRGPFHLPEPRREAHFGPELRGELVAARARAQELESARPSALPRTIAVADGTPEDVRVHARGSHLALVGEPVARGPMHLFDAHVRRPEIAASSSGRLELARWMTDPAHPLTARVAVNRIWAAHFGRGLVASPSNFGLRGEAPSHPELLDWLASEFVAAGWSHKRMHRLILSSRAWRGSSDTTASAHELDPDGRWISRHARTRLEAELVRDRLLAVAGRLDRTLGGTLLDTENGGYVTNDQSANAARYETPRRSLYLPVVRNAMYELFSNFDYADPSVPLEQRSSTTIASQALFFLNSPLVEDTARRLAEAVLARPDPRERVARLWDDVLLRAPDEREFERALALVERLTELQRPTAEPELPVEALGLGARHEMPVASTTDALELRSWLGLARALLSSNEFLYVD